MIDDAPTEHELRTAVHELVDQFMGAAEDVHGHIPGVGTPAWWIAPTSARLAGLLVLAEAYVLRSPEQIAADILKAASVEVSEEWRRQRELIRRRKDEIGRALRSGDGARAIALTEHHASDRWAVEVA